MHPIPPRRNLQQSKMWGQPPWDLAKDRDPLKDSDAYRRLNDARIRYGQPGRGP